MPLARLGFVE